MRNLRYTQIMHSLLQTKEWTDFKASQGWMSHQIDDIFVLEKKLPLRQSFLYAPEVEYKLLQNTKIYKNTKEIAENNHAIFFRLEVIDEFDEKIVEILEKNHFIKSFEEIQPEWRQIIDLAKSEAEILAQMKQKGRYNIKIAQRNGVIIEKSKNIDDFYKIFRETAKRDGFEIRPKQYFEKMMNIFGSRDVAELWVAKYNERTIAAAIVTFYDGVATYLYGASSDEYRNVMAPYVLHWRIIQEAKKLGMARYDLLAVSPEDRNRLEENGKWLGNRKMENRDHKYAGITRFKEQFGGRKVQIVGSWDLVYKPSWYKIFKIIENFRRK